MSAGTFAYGVAAGLGVGVALIALFIGVRRAPPRSMDVSLVLLGLAGALSASVHLWLQSADTVDDYASILRGPFAVVGLVGTVVMVWVVAISTRVGWPRIPLALTVGALVVGVVHFSTRGVIVDEVTALREVSLLGETMQLHEPARASWRPVLDAFLLAVTLYVAIALYRRWRSAEPGYGWFVAGVALAYAALLYDSLVDEALVGTAYLAPFGSLAFTMCFAWLLASRLSELERRLVAQSAQLESLVTARTQELRQANQQVLHELDRQNQVAGHMVQLTQHLNALGVDDARGSGLEPSLIAAVESIGELVEATAVRLELYEATTAGDRAGVDWQRPGRSTNGDSAPDIATRDLRVGDLELGRLTVVSPQVEPPRVERQHLISLSADYLSVAIHRRTLAAELVGEAVDDERRRIARDLHDSVSQRLYAAAFNAESLSRTASRDPSAAATTADRIRSLVLVSLAELRTLLFEMEPEILANSSITGLITKLCESTSAAHERAIEVTAIDGPPVPVEVKLALYRIAQEALGNALRHAGRSSIRVTVEVDASGVRLEVVDDGVGIPAEPEGWGSGLRNMAQRAEEVGAEFAIESSADIGTAVLVNWEPAEPDDLTLDLTSVTDREPARR